MSAPENPPAFPRDHRHLGQNGMTLRDWFAGQVLAGSQASETVMGFLASGPRGEIYVRMAERSYLIADAMLAARARARGDDA